MGSGYRLRVFLIALVAGTAGSSLHATGDQAQGTLDQGTVVNIAVKLATEATHSHTYATNEISFEPSTREWTAQIEASLDLNSTKHLVVTVNESTGLACLQLPPAAGCVVKEDIHQLVADAQAKAEAADMARKHPAPDLQNLTEVLLRHQFDAERSPRGGVPRVRYFVSLPSPDAKGLADLSPEIIANLKRDGIETYPGSTWKQDAKNGSMDMRFSVGLPVSRADGNYDVPYNYYCGPLCAGWYTAVMKHDAEGWHIVSTVMNAIS